MTSEPIVFVVDDDSSLRKSLEWLIKSVGLSVETHASAQSFLDRYDPARPGCLVLDLRMPGMSGLELQTKLTEQDIDIPVIMITGHGEVPTAVRAMKSGALDFIEKPFSDQALLDRIQQAIEQDARTRKQHRFRRDALRQIEVLTPREREVMDLVVGGLPNKKIASELSVSEKTVEVHRAHVMKKLSAPSLADLVRLALAAEGDRGNP